jgi:hypothetical protein
MLIAPITDQPQMLSSRARILYSSPNGDRWLLCRERGRIFVRHEPNAPSGGQPSEIEIGTFLSGGPLNPERQALLRLIATLVDQDDESQGQL